MNYYNEHDPDAAAILRVLIDEGLIAPGIVDERSIEDVRPDELAGYTQCHFFAGIGIWSLALRASGWPDDRPIWTGSCPCQPFSAAGKGDGFADERHLWPTFYHLISQCRPAEIRGEQVASKAVDHWIDLVHADLEALGYAFGSVPFPSAGVGAPHIRDRNYWAGRLAKTNSKQHDWRGRFGQGWGIEHPDSSAACGMAYAGPNTDAGEAATANHERAQTDRSADQLSGRSEPGNPGPTNGLWAAADWLLCRDGKWRPVEPGTFPLAPAGTFRNRVAALRGAGNAINFAAAQAFCEAVTEAA